MLGTAYTYVPNGSLPRGFMVDIDGTLAHMNGRGPFEWHRVGEDTLDRPVAYAVQHLAEMTDCIVMSGRDESCRAETEAWLIDNGIPWAWLFMRPEGDNRNDAIVKLELFRKQVAPRWDVQFVFDDRQRVVDMWRAIGLKCFQVEPGD